MKKVKKKKQVYDTESMKLEQKLAAMFEARNIEEFIDVRKRPFSLMYWNFIIGLSRGIGFLLGATVVGALLIAFGKHTLVRLGGMPWLGEKVAQAYIYINEIVKNTPVPGH
jgi:uncharacterized membrane protein